MSLINNRFLVGIIRLLHSEPFLWLIFGIVISFRFIFHAIAYPNEFGDVFNQFYFDALLGILIIIFPFVYFQIFSKYPFESLRNKKNFNKDIVVNGNHNIVNLGDDSKNELDITKIKNGIDMLNILVKNAETISNKIYIRAGIYLIFGVFIALSGILYFSFASTASTFDSDDASKQIISLLPRFGILFFIEFIAFFFLKQYRSAMDEFKYYDEIKRTRESQLALYVIASKDYNVKKFSTVINKLNLFDKVGVLSKNETTELIESSKSNENELNDIMKQLTELMKVSKTK